MLRTDTIKKKTCYVKICPKFSVGTLVNTVEKYSPVASTLLTIVLYFQD